jgi:hypothetical protein
MGVVTAAILPSESGYLGAYLPLIEPQLAFSTGRSMMQFGPE